MRGPGEQRIVKKNCWYKACEFLSKRVWRSNRLEHKQLLWCSFWGKAYQRGCDVWTYFSFSNLLTASMESTPLQGAMLCSPLPWLKSMGTKGSKGTWGFLLAEMGFPIACTQKWFPFPRLVKQDISMLKVLLSTVTEFPLFLYRH